jgi:hypothetical protein
MRAALEKAGITIAVAVAVYCTTLQFALLGPRAAETVAAMEEWPSAPFGFTGLDHELLHIADEPPPPSVAPVAVADGLPPAHAPASADEEDTENELRADPLYW